MIFGQLARSQFCALRGVVCRCAILLEEESGGQSATALKE